MDIVSSEGFSKPTNSNPGAAPMLRWVEISNLVIDRAYQRPITGKGRRQIEEIVRNFSWAFFAPVIVSPVEGGRFAIIDGQHRTTAAAIVGLESVPCQVVILPQNEQAAAFRAINGNTTPITRIALHSAALTAEDPLALEAEQVARRGGVDVLRYPISGEKILPGQTLAIGALYSCIRKYGSSVVELSLKCITTTANNIPGSANARNIKAISKVLSDNPGWRESEDRLIRAFDEIDLARLSEAPTFGGGRPRLQPDLASKISSRLAAALTSDKGQKMQGGLRIAAVAAQTLS